MTAELGGFTGIVEPDAETVRFLRERRGVDVESSPGCAATRARAMPTCIRVDCSSALADGGARPATRATACALADARRSRVRGRHRLRRLVHGRQARGLRPVPRGAGAGPRDAGCASPPHVQLYLQFGTTAVRDYCIAPRLRSRLRGGRRAHPAAVVRRLRELRAGLVDRAGAGDRQRDQPQLPRPLGAGRRCGWRARRRSRPAPSPASWRRSKNCDPVPSLTRPRQFPALRERRRKPLLLPRRRPRPHRRER